MKVIIQTPRFIIREFAPENLEKYIALNEKESVMKHIFKRTRADVEAKFNNALHDYANGLNLSRWGIFNPADDDFIGTCMLKQSDNDPDKIELGYILDEPYWGRGLATELAVALVKYGFETMNLTEICACTTGANIASQNVLLKAGLKRGADIFWHGAYIPFFVAVKEESER
jgi:ribosomal-protein-alanine N-acetyltransferase